MRRRETGDSEGKAPLEILSTHPSDATRIKKLEEEMPEAMKCYKPEGGK